DDAAAERLHFVVTPCEPGRLGLERGRVREVEAGQRVELPSQGRPRVNRAKEFVCARRCENDPERLHVRGENASFADVRALEFVGGAERFKGSADRIGLPFKGIPRRKRDRRLRWCAAGGARGVPSHGERGAGGARQGEAEEDKGNGGSAFRE